MALRGVGSVTKALRVNAGQRLLATGKVNFWAEYEGIQRTRFSDCSTCCFSVTENPRIFHMSVRDVQTSPAKFEKCWWTIRRGVKTNLQMTSLTDSNYC